MASTASEQQNPSQKLWIWILTGEDTAGLERSLNNAQSHGQLGILTLSGLDRAQLKQLGLNAEIKLITGSWNDSVSGLWQQALQSSPEGTTLLLEAGETLSPDNWKRLETLQTLSSCGILTVRRNETLEQAPRLFYQPAEIQLSGDVYPQAEGAQLGIEIDASQSTMFYQLADQRRIWLQRLASKGQTSPDVHFELGTLSFKAQRDLEALAHFEALSKREETDFWTLSGRVMELKVRWELHQHQQTMEMLERYRAQNLAIEGLPSVWVLRGVIARHFKETDLAMDCFQQALDLAKRENFSLHNPLVALPDITWKPLLGLAEIQLKEGLFSQAYLNFSQVREYLPNHDYVLTELIKAAFFLRRYDTLREILASGTTLRGLSEPTRELLNLMLEIHQPLKNQREPLQILLTRLKNEASQISHDPFLVSVMLEAAILLLQRGMPAEGQTMLLLLTHWLPNQPIIWHNLAFTYFSVQDYPQAEEYYRRALAIDPDFHDSRFDLGKVLVMQQRKSEAIAEFQALQQRQPQDQRVRQALKQLEPDEFEAFVPPVSKLSESEPEMPFIFVFPLTASWSNGADIALKAYYQEFIAEDRVIFAFPQSTENDLMMEAKTWAEQHFGSEFLPPVALLPEALPLIESHSAWVLPWRLNPGQTLLNSLDETGFPVITTQMTLPTGQPLPASLTTDAKRIWLETDTEALQNQMRLSLNKAQQESLTQAQSAQVNTHTWLALEAPETPNPTEEETQTAHTLTEQPETATPGLSVCLIIKDEANMLPGCLDSIHDQVEEIIVVDTGSSDQSREIAASYPKVRLYQSDWTGDFAAARNLAVSYATQAWIFSLDADETVSADFIATLKLYLSGLDQPDAYAFPILAINPDGSLDDVHSLQCVPRVFPNQPEYRYRGRIHEMIVHSQRQKMRYFYMKQLPIYHRGYQPEVIISKQKRLRDASLMEQMIAEAPSAPETQRLYLVLADLYARENGQSGLEQALNTLEEGLKQVQSDDLIRSMLIRRRIQTLLELNRTTAVLDETLDKISDPQIAMYRSEALQRTGNRKEALETAQQALDLTEAQSLMPDPHEQLPKRQLLLKDLARQSEQVGDLQAALYYFKRSLKLDPSPENLMSYQALKKKAGI